MIKKKEQEKYHTYNSDTLHLFARWHQGLVGFQNVSEGFFDVLLFHARQHSRRQKQRQTPLFPADK